MNLNISRPIRMAVQLSAWLPPGLPRKWLLQLFSRIQRYYWPKMIEAFVCRMSVRIDFHDQIVLG